MLRSEQKGLEFSGLQNIPDDEERYYNSHKCEIYDIVKKVYEQTIEDAIKCIGTLIDNSWINEKSISPSEFIEEFRKIMINETSN